MSFSSHVKEELSKQISPARHCQISELAAMLSFCGRIQISENNRYRIKIHTENGAVARKCFTLLKKTFNIGADVSIRRNAFQKKSHTYTVAVQDHQEALKVLQATKLLQEDGEIGDSLSLVNNVIVMQSCCRRSFIRGAFLVAGSSVIRKSFTILRLSVPARIGQNRFRRLLKLLVLMRKW